MQFRLPEAPLRITHPDLAATLAEVDARLAAGRGFALATLNLDHLSKLRGDPAFRAAYLAHDIVVADGHPVVWLSHLAGDPVRLVPGSDLVLPLARLAAARGRPVALVGSTAPVLDRAAQVLCQRVPGLQVALTLAPPMGFDPDGAEAAAILSRLEGAGVGLAFLAFGAPKQERLAARGRSLAPAFGFVSVGAGLDFLAGAQQRAPRWMQVLALEWLWRALQQPRRMVPRYAACAAMLPGAALDALRQRASR